MFEDRCWPSLWEPDCSFLLQFSCVFNRRECKSTTLYPDSPLSLKECKTTGRVHSFPPNPSSALVLRRLLSSCERACLHFSLRSSHPSSFPLGCGALEEPLPRVLLFIVDNLNFEMKSGPWNLKIKTNKACFSYPFSWWSPDLSQCLPDWLFQVPDTGRHSLSHIHCPSDWREILGREKVHKYETLSHPPILWVFPLLHFLPWPVMLISSCTEVFKNIAGDFQHLLLFSFSLLSSLPTHEKPKLFSL